LFSFHRLALAALLTAGLAACGGVQNVETAKTAAYNQHPRTILAMQQNGDPFPDIFKATLMRRLSACGVTMKFAPLVEGTAYNNWPEAETRLLFRQLGKVTKTVKKKSTGQVLDKFAELYRYEFSLYDVASDRTVWTGHGDFPTHDDIQDVHMVNPYREQAAESWSDDLIGLMKKDGLLGSCSSA
jgi:hypothetical protein